jgi:hypothetical protein
MFQRLFARALIVTLALFSAAACSSVSRHDAQDGRVVIVYAPDRQADAMTARTNLRALGFRVHVEPEGPAVRTESVVAIYRVGRYEGRVTAVESALEDLGSIETRPFFQPGPEGTDVVVWLVAHDRQAAAGALDAEDAVEQAASPVDESAPTAPGE